MARQHAQKVREVADLTTKVYNLEETYEPAPFGGGPTTCRCEKPDLYCKKCKGRRE